METPLYNKYAPKTMVNINLKFSIGKGNGNPLQCSCLENPRGGGAWWAAVCGVAQSRTRLKQLSSSNSISCLFADLCCCLPNKSHLTLLHPMDCSLPGASVHGILQTRILEWFAISSSRGSSDPGTELVSPELHADSLPLSYQGEK